MLIEMIFHPSRHRRQPEASPDGVRGPPIVPTETIPPRIMGPIAGRSASIGRSLSQIDRQDEERQTTEEQKQLEEKRRRDMMQCVMLEAGILFHSIFIGMALSVSINNEFVVLLIAIAFHRKYIAIDHELYEQLKARFLILTMRQINRNIRRLSSWISNC